MQSLVGLDCGLEKIQKILTFLDLILDLKSICLDCWIVNIGLAQKIQSMKIQNVYLSSNSRNLPISVRCT